MPNQLNNIEYYAQFHLSLLLILYPGESPSKLIREGISINDLITEMNARILQLQAQSIKNETSNQQRKQKKREALSKFIG